MEAVITKEMIMGDIVSKFPQAVPVMLNYGLHCVGCHVNAFETLEQGAMGHGMSEEEMEQLLSDVNEAVQESASTKKQADSIVFTRLAVEKVKEFSEKMDKTGWGLRLEVIPGGCAGQTYGLDFDENAKDSDKVIEQDGVKLFVNKEDFEVVKGSKIDYLDTLQGAGFRVDNPNAHSSCGCGKSFN